jgi:hypothetical protein
MLPWIHSIRCVHHRYSHEHLRVVIVRGEGKSETMVTTPEEALMFKVIYHAIKGVRSQCSLGSIQYAVSIIGLVTNTSE